MNSLHAPDSDVEYLGTDEILAGVPRQTGVGFALDDQVQRPRPNPALTNLIERIATAFDEILATLDLSAMASCPSFFALRAGPSSRFLAEALLPRIIDDFAGTILIPYVKGLPRIERVLPHAKMLSLSTLKDLVELPDNRLLVFQDADTQPKASFVLEWVRECVGTAVWASREQSTIVLLEIFEPVENELASRIRDLMREWVASTSKIVLWLHSSVSYTPIEILDQFQNFLIFQPTPAELHTLSRIRWMDRQDINRFSKNRCMALASGPSVPDTQVWKPIHLEDFEEVLSNQTNKVPALRAVILTALPTEFKAVTAHLINVEERRHHGTIYERGYFSLNSLHTWEVLVAEIGPGNQRAAAEAERAINYSNPDIALFVGVAGGLKTKDVSIGDVVAATKVYGYESGKAEAEMFKTRPDVMNSTHSLEQQARAEARNNNWCGTILGERPEHDPKAHVAPIAAGQKVIRSFRAAVCEFILNHYNDALAVEMEGIGFLEAAHMNEKVKALVVRGISDLLDDKDQADQSGSQEVAARHASAFAFQVLAHLDLS